MVQDIIFRFSVFLSGSRGTTSAKTNLRLLFCFQDSLHQVLKLVCTLSPDCFDPLSSNFVVIDITHGKKPIDLILKT